MASIGAFQHLACLAGRHKRSRRLARSVQVHERSLYASVCEGCGRPMIKDHRGWRQMSADERALIAADGTAS